MRSLHHGSITHETTLDFTDFVLIFRSFSLRMRKDIKDLFEQFAQSIRSLSDNSLNEGSSPRTSPEPPHVHQKIRKFRWSESSVRAVVFIIVYIDLASRAEIY